MANIHLSNRVTEWEVLPTASLHGKILELQNKGEKIIDLTIGISNLPIPVAAKEATISALTNDNTPYTAVSGDSGLKRAIQQKLKQQNNMNYDIENILVTTGAKQAIFQALYVLTNPGDKVAVMKPYWPAYTQIMEMLKLEPFFINISDLNKLNTVFGDTNIKAFLFDLPHNPSGKVFTETELISLLLFAKKKNIFIIADESYEKLIYEGDRISLATLDESMREMILTIFSVSQSYSMMGWRLGYAVGEKNIIAAMEAVQSAITAATPYISQTAVTAILTANDNYPEKLVQKFKQRRDTVYPILKNIPWISCDLPASGPYFWCNIEKLTKNSKKFAEKLLEQQKVAVLPGEPLGAPGWIRIAFNVQPAEILKEAFEKIKFFGGTYE